MAAQALFNRAVRHHLPSAIVVPLERVDDVFLGKVFTYEHKPYALLPWRKHELNFTDYSLSELLVKDSNLEFAKSSKFLFDIGKGTETVDTTAGGDVDLQEALSKLKLDLKGKAEKKTSITTEFGNVTHIETDLFEVLSSKKLSLDISNPIVKEARSKGSTIFIISTLYEAERCNISVSVTDSVSESEDAGASVSKEGVTEDESAARSDNDIQVTTRDIPTPIAFLLLKLTIDSKGELTPHLRSGLDEHTRIHLPFGTRLGTDPPIEAPPDKPPAEETPPVEEKPPSDADKDKPATEDKPSTDADKDKPAADEDKEKPPAADKPASD